MTFEEWWEQNWLTITCLMPVGPGNAKETARAIWQPATAAAMERCAIIAESLYGDEDQIAFDITPDDLGCEIAIAIRKAADD